MSCRWQQWPTLESSEKDHGNGSDTHSVVGEQRRVRVRQHWGRPHHGVAGAHGLHVHVTGIGRPTVLSGQVLRAWPGGHGLQSRGGRLCNPAWACCPLLHCQGIGDIGTSLRKSHWCWWKGYQCKALSRPLINSLCSTWTDACKFKWALYVNEWKTSNEAAVCTSIRNKNQKHWQTHRFGDMMTVQCLAQPPRIRDLIKLVANLP